MPIARAPVNTIPRVINIYNIDDLFVFQAWYSVLLPHRRVPSTKLLTLAQNELAAPRFEPNENIKSVFVPQLGFVFTKFSDSFKKILGKDIQNETDKTQRVQLHAHCNIVNFTGVIDDKENILTQLPDKMLLSSLPYTLLDFIYKVNEYYYITKQKYTYEGGGSKNQGCSITYLPTKKVYKVRQNSDKKKYIIMNKNKVYLKDIKGKFRYIK